MTIMIYHSEAFHLSRWNGLVRSRATKLQLSKLIKQEYFKKVNETISSDLGDNEKILSIMNIIRDYAEEAVDELMQEKKEAVDEKIAIIKAKDDIINSYRVVTDVFDRLLAEKTKVYLLCKVF